MERRWTRCLVRLRHRQEESPSVAKNELQLRQTIAVQLSIRPFAGGVVGRTMRSLRIL